MNTLFITAGPIGFASSRLRCYWPARHIPGADVIPVQEFERGRLSVERVFEYDNVVFQKVSSPEVMKKLKAQGKHVIYDLCDPLHWFSPYQVRDTLPHITHLTASTHNLAQELMLWADMLCWVVNDGLDLSYHYAPTLVKVHKPTEQLRFVWFGMSQNRIALVSALAYLERLHANGRSFELLVVDDQPDKPIEVTFPYQHKKWELETEVETLLSADVAILPPYPGPWGKMKSLNKAATAQALGLPVVDGLNYVELCEMFDTNRRIEQGAEGRHWAETAWDCRRVATEWTQVMK